MMQDGRLPALLLAWVGKQEKPRRVRRGGSGGRFVIRLLHEIDGGAGLGIERADHGAA